jgi:hypothetical protein
MKVHVTSVFLSVSAALVKSDLPVLGVSLVRGTPSDLANRVLERRF